MKFILNEVNGEYSVDEPVTGDDIITQAERILTARLTRPSYQMFQNPTDVKTFLKMHLAHLKAEAFAVLFMDNRHRMLAYETMFNGTIDGATVHPREVVRRALEHNAAAVILSHNHPSGVAQPSQADQRITQRLKEALGLIDVRVIDHIVVGSDETFSFAEQGLL